MKNRKRSFGFLLLLIIVPCLLSVTAFAANPESDFQYHTTSQHVLISKYVGQTQEVVIPDTFEGKPVHTIEPRAFVRNRSIYSVKLPGNIQTIAGSAFAGCTNLKIVVIPDTRLPIRFGNDAFKSVGSSTSPAKLIIPDTSHADYPAEGKNVEWLGGHFDVIKMGHHRCLDEAPTKDGKCDICGKIKKNSGSVSIPAPAPSLGKTVAETAAVVGKTVAKYTVKALITATLAIRSILKLF